MRSAFGDGLLRQVEALEASERAAVLALVPEETLAHYRRVMPVGWTSMEQHMEVSNAIRAVVGSERNIEVWHETMAALTGRPLLSGFLRHIGMRLGISPGTLYRQTARLWTHLCREVGDLYADVGESQTTAELSGFPAGEHSFPCFVEGLHGCLTGLVTPFDVSVQVRVMAVDLKAGVASYDITW